MAKKNRAAVALGKLGGRVRMDSMTPEERREFARKGGEAGGSARALSLSPRKRSQIARKAAQERWAKVRDPNVVMRGSVFETSAGRYEVLVINGDQVVYKAPNGIASLRPMEEFRKLVGLPPAV